MIARLQAGAPVVEPSPPVAPVWDRDTIMLELTARDQALRTFPTPEVRLVDAGEGARQFLIGDAPVGRASFGAVCKFLDVPSYFMMRAPLPLANEVAAGMLKDPEVEGRELIFNHATSVVVGSRPKGQKVVPAARVFEKLFSTLPEAEGIYLHQEDRAVDVGMVCRSLDIEPKKGDLVRGGLQCLYSEVDAKRATIRAYSERLICTNGMTHREFSRDFGISGMADNFLGEIGASALACYEHVKQSLAPKLRHAAEFEVNGPQAIRRIFRQSRLNPKFLDGVLAAHALEDDGTMFGVLQAFTRAANSLLYRDRVRLQATAGDELVAVENAHCPACYALM